MTGAGPVLLPIRKRTRHALLPYDTIREQVQDADLFLCRSMDMEGVSIEVGTVGGYSHAIMAAWLDKAGERRLWAFEMNGQWNPHGSLPMSEVIKQRSGRVDWFPVNAERFPEFDRAGAVLRMMDLSGQTYPRWDNYRMAVSRMFVLRWLWAWDWGKRLLQPENWRPNGPFNCSGSYDNACMVGGGVKPVPRISSHWVTPDMLAHTHFNDYAGTITA